MLGTPGSALAHDRPVDHFELTMIDDGCTGGTPAISQCPSEQPKRMAITRPPHRAEIPRRVRDAPLVSIVIVAFGHRQITERCLHSIEQSLGDSLGKSVELILVDNASPDDTMALFGAWSERATIVALEHNHNFAGGCNAGATEARGEVLVFLNNDTIVEPGMLEKLASQANQPDAGAAGLRLLYLDGTLQHAGVAMVRVPTGRVVPHHLFHHQDGQLPAARATYDLDTVTGACLAIQRKLFAELGGYDEGYANGWEDVDLCLRVRAADRRVIYRGDLWLWHDEGQTRGQVRGLEANGERFYRRWNWALDSDEELIDRVFGGRIAVSRRAAGMDRPAAITLTGTIAGVASASSEARGLLAAFRSAGLSVAASELLPEIVEADLTDVEAQDTWNALTRKPSRDTPHVHVPYGCLPPAGAILRLARMPPALAGNPATVWSASPRLCEELTSAGWPPRLVAWLPPCVPTGPAGPGGGGVLGILPGHDLDAAEAALEALTSVASEHLRILPTVASSPLLALIAKRLPGAELLAPCTSDTRLRELASEADVVLCADPDDTFDRRGLVAASAGAAAVTALDGPAHAVLADHAVPLASLSAAHLRAGLERALELATAREQRAAAVRDQCNERICGKRIAQLLTSLQEANAA